jgi:3-methyladenine DNA glycosylase AlkD
MKTMAIARARSIDEDVRTALAWLERKSTQRDRDNMARFGITATKYHGVSVANIRVLAKQLGGLRAARGLAGPGGASAEALRRHALAAALWDTGWYEARMLTSFIDDPALVTAAQMDRWCRDFDNWGICDTLCFHLFDKTPHAWHKVSQWSGKRDEFVKRAAFALLASLALHDKRASDARFLAALPLIERAAGDDRNFVKKGVSWALRLIGRRNAALHGAAVPLARRLAASPDKAARWVGNDAFRELTSAAVTKRLSRVRASR